jgi:outer membrane protein OmpA-like peptidoglycan-associated protein
MLVMFVAAGCCTECMQPKKAAPVPIVTAPPAPPPYVEPVTAPPPPPVVVAPVAPPPPPALPPEVVQEIKDLDKLYPGMFTYDKGVLVFSSDVTFDSGSAVVKPDARAALSKLATILVGEKVKDRQLTIVGHTDTDHVVKPATIDNLKRLGKSADNKGLSEARAESVAAVLKAGGIDSSRMSTVGKGEGEPVADNRTPDGKARNRRVEIFITPAKSGT